MVQFSPTQQRLLNILSDGQRHSGTQLGQQLKITRSAIWKQVNQLVCLGIKINKIAHQGYQLPQPISLLDKQLIDSHLKQRLLSPYKLHLFASIDSTNSYLKEQVATVTQSTASPSHLNQIDICCAELQTQGRGRFGRHWYSPFGENIYCSSRWTLHCDLSKLSGLSLVTSLAVLATVKQYSPAADIKIKWPNDILWQGKKLCGSLIEIIAESNHCAQIIVGIGLNVNSHTQNHTLADKPWCSLFDLSDQQYNRNYIIADLLIHLEAYLTRFLNHDLQIFMSEWNKHDYLIGKRITINHSSGTFSGLAVGINANGQLIIEDEGGRRHYFSSGDTSLAHY